ncbi:hypothetical protein GOV03_00725 [Candidatus Woesearchaeota archaeon]|nr:hypothetical protein [Candidatus Woesearchaeota archaeon]
MNPEKFEPKFDNGIEAELEDRGRESSRERLLSLEREGKFVFHGSPIVIEILEPRQANNWDEKTKKMEKDGEPCIVATPFAEVAIFRAVVNSKNVEEGNFKSEFSMNEGGLLKFSASRETLEKIKGKKGLVYILNKSDFEQFSDMEWRASKELKPQEAIEVTSNDLPENIGINFDDEDKKPEESQNEKDTMEQKIKIEEAFQEKQEGSESIEEKSDEEQKEKNE